MNGVEGMNESRMSSDDRMDALCLTDFYGYGCLVYAWVSTHCRGVFQVAMHEYGDE